MSPQHDSKQTSAHRFWCGPKFALHVTAWLDSASLLLSIATTQGREELHVQGMFMAAHGLELALKGLVERETRPGDEKRTQLYRTHNLDDLWKWLGKSEIARARLSDYPIVDDMLARFQGASPALRYVSEGSARSPEPPKQGAWPLHAGRTLGYGDSEALLWAFVAFTQWVWHKSKEDWPEATREQWETLQQKAKDMSFAERSPSEGLAKWDWERRIGTCTVRIGRSFSFQYDSLDPAQERPWVSQLRDARLSDETISDIMRTLSRVIQEAIEPAQKVACALNESIPAGARDLDASIQAMHSVLYQWRQGIREAGQATTRCVACPNIPDSTSPTPTDCAPADESKA